jgi:hypothetical protein
VTEDQYFGHLERRVSRELAGMPQKEIRGMWCDGFLPDRFVATGRGSHVAGRAWMDDGHGNQSLWNFVLLLGPLPVERAAVNWSEHLPAENSTGWLYLDFERQFLKIKLSAAYHDGNSTATKPISRDPA